MLIKLNVLLIIDLSVDAHFFNHMHLIIKNYFFIQSILYNFIVNNVFISLLIFIIFNCQEIIIIKNQIGRIPGEDPVNNKFE